MATNTTASTKLAQLIKTYYEKKMLELLTPNLVYHQFGIPKALPKREGNQIFWHRWNMFGYGRLINESAAGTARGISATRISATLYRVGDHALITTYLDMVTINSVVEGAIELFSDSAALTLDYMTSRLLLLRFTSASATFQASAAGAYIGVLKLSAQMNDATNYVGTLSAAKFQAPLWGIDDLTTRNHAISACQGQKSATLLTPNILRTLALKLKVKHAKRFEDGYYKAIVHPDLVNQLRGSSAFVDLHKYTETGIGMIAKGAMQQGTGEVGVEGVLEGFKFYSTTEAPYTVATSAAKLSSWGAGRLYFSFFFGKGAYGVTDFDGGINTYVKTPGPQTTSDPLNLYSTVGYRIIYTAKVLNNSACLWLMSGRPSTVG